MAALDEIPAEPEPVPAPKPVREPEPLPEPPVLTADLLADLAMPAPRPRLLGGANAPEASVPATPAPAVKRGRPKKKVVEPAPASEAPVRKGRKASEPESPVAEPAPAPSPAQAQDQNRQDQRPEEVP